MYFSILHSAPFNFQPYSRGWNTWKNHFWFWNIITTRNRNITTWNRICLIDSSFSCLQMPRTQISCPFQINLAKNNIFKAFLAFGPFLLDRDPRARTPINTSGKDMQDCFHLKNHSHQLSILKNSHYKIKAGSPVSHSDLSHDLCDL